MRKGDVASVKKACQKAGTSFIYKKGADNTEDQASFLFVGKQDGEEVVFDTFIYTLELEFYANIFADAEEHVKTVHPKFKDADFDAENGEHIDLMEEAANELSNNSDYEVQEFVEIDCNHTPEDEGVPIDACLKVPEINEEVIERFVKDFNNENLNLDETFYSFNMEE